MFASVFARLVGLVFAVVQIVLTLRLVLPFVDVPAGLVQHVPTLRTASDLLIAPFRGLTDLIGLDVDRFSGAEQLIGAGIIEKIDPSVIIAMVGWSIVGLVVVFALRVFGAATRI